MAPGRPCTQEQNRKKCNCTYECSRKGNCCECLRYHWFSNRELPACFFPAEAERTYDRSLDHFLSIENARPRK